MSDSKAKSDKAQSDKVDETKVMDDKVFNLPMQMRILDNRIGTEFALPRYATEGSAGLDLIACIPGPIEIKQGKEHLIATGIAIHINHPNVVGMIFPRSSMRRKGLELEGVIDSDYQGEIFMSCRNWNQNALVISPGDRIAQLLLMPVVRGNIEVVDKFTNTTKRGSGGFGSTGVSAK
jgi:dUTP pyrophosphatase